MRFFLPVFLFISVVSGWAQPSYEFFEKKVRPIFANSCQTCHNAKLKTAGLDLSSAEGFALGGQSGPIVNANDPEASSLLKVIGYGETMKMPPTGKLKDEEIADLTAWVKTGAVWPGLAKSTV